ncbi:MAG: ABC transporter permease [Geminicoccaceae bacterium]|nr:MAG: ABC transporter permease [Geminicoccaceae bacterium]
MTPERIRGLLVQPEGRLALITLLVFLLMAWLTPDRFLSVQNLTSMAFQFPEFAILALAMTIVMLTGGIDLSVIGVANLAAIVAALLLTQIVGPGVAEHGTFWVVVAMLAALAVGALAGLVNGVLVAWLGLPPILATLGSGLVFTGFGVALTGGSAVMGLPAEMAWIGNGRLWGIPVPLVLFAGLALLLWFVLTHTAFGLKVRMFGANPLAARFAAIDINAMLLRVYVSAGMLSAVAGLLIMSRANSAKFDYGSSYLLLAILIAVLGGVNPYGGYGRIIGVVLAVLSMQFLSSGLNMLGVSNFARELIWGSLLILVMVINASPNFRILPRGWQPPGARQGPPG